VAGVTFKAHKIILAACSKHFQDLFEAAPFCPNILVILDGTSSVNMSALLEFMYKGEVHVSQESLSGFLKAAESLQVNQHFERPPPSSPSILRLISFERYFAQKNLRYFFNYSDKDFASEYRR
ncbi:hypothetical protein WDU94_008054, partial [Cyamophila willieti]